MFHKAAHDLAGPLLHIAGHMGVGIQGEGRLGVPQDAGQGLGVYPGGQGMGGKCVPITYNKDKTEKSPVFKGFRTCPYSFPLKNGLKLGLRKKANKKRLRQRQILLVLNCNLT